MNRRIFRLLVVMAYLARSLRILHWLAKKAGRSTFPLSGKAPDGPVLGGGFARGGPLSDEGVSPKEGEQ
jgi:hypothetical protein